MFDESSRRYEHNIRWLGVVALVAAVLMVGLILVLAAKSDQKQPSISEIRPPDRYITKPVQVYSRYALALYDCSGTKAHDACFYQRMITTNSDQPLVQQFYREQLASLYVAGPPLQLDPRIIRPPVAR